MDSIETKLVPGYPSITTIKNVLSLTEIKQLESYYIASLLNDNFILDSVYGKNRLYMRNDEQGYQLLFKFRTKVENIVNEKLAGRYSFVSYYRKGSILNRHIDKPECEYTLAIRLFSSKENTNEIPYLIFGDKISAVHIHASIGDGAIFQGNKTPHWRDTLESEFLCTLLLHYEKKIN